MWNLRKILTNLTQKPDLMNLELQVLADLRRHEGCRLTAYKDTVGVWTIGYGHTKGVFPGMTITQEQAEEWLREGMLQHWEDARSVYKDLDKLDKVRQSVLINMAFNLGRAKLAQFKNTLRLIAEGNYSTAASNMLDSLWAAQVKGRATELAKRMATGKIEPKHLYVGE
jgi:lysozyme